MLLLAQQDYKVPQIARIVLRSEDTVARVLKRFLAGGLDAVPRRTPPGRERRVTAAWEAELLRVIELDPHEVGVRSANWTTELLGSVLRPAHRDTGHGGDGARVLACEWVRLQTPDLDRCLAKRQSKRVTWEKTAGRGRVSRSHSRLHLSPCEAWSKLICGVNAPADVPHLLALLPQADLYLQDEVQFAFHPTLTRVWCLKGRRGQRLVEAPGDTRTVYGFGLLDWRDGWFDGRIAAFPNF